MTLLILLLAAATAPAATYRVAGTGFENANDPKGNPPATSHGLFALSSVAETPDGGFLIASQGYVRKVGPDGRIATVAGRGGTRSSGDGGPAKDAIVDPSGIAALPDGGYLFSDGISRVRQVGPDGIIRTVAGGPQSGFGGDGGPATGGKFQFPEDVAVLPGGGFLVADQFNHRIRKVGADGIITTVAGTGPSGNDKGEFAGDGGPATAARLDSPQSVAALPDGGFLIADTGNFRVRRVGPDGVIHTVAGNGKPGADANLDGKPALTSSFGVRDVAVMADGSVAIAASGHVYKLGNDGNMTLLGPGFTAAATADNGILATYLDDVLYLAPANPTRMAVALSPATFSQGASPKAIFDATLPGTAEAVIVSGTRTVARASGTAQPGTNTLPVNTVLKKGVEYRLNLTVTSPSGQIATASLPLLGPGLLPAALARRIANLYADARGDAAYYQRVRRCRRMTSRRIDCRIDEIVADDPKGCTYILSVQLPTSGRLATRTYRCARRTTYTKRPRWRGRAVPLPDEFLGKLEAGPR
ncbi:MAG: hypothetical protein H0T15_03720 [Thermoleophilaceae bacterium]|nr:hypothetical protein [Thermoleophilaceae bacterium]